MLNINEAGMKDRIIFFLLGGLLATISYLAGDINNINAQHDQNRNIFEKDVLIKGNLLVKGITYISNETTMVNAKNI